jgi:hypothetical protein
MTISTTIVKNSYSGDNSTSTFNYTFKVLSSADLKVIIRNASGVEVTKTLTTHYTIANVGNASGGSITFTAGNIPTSTETVVLLRDTDQIQSIDYISNDPFPAETHEEGLDRSVIIAQELQEEVDRSLKLSRTNTMTNTEFTVGPTERANKVLGFDSSGELSVTSTIGENKGNWAAGTAYNVRDIIKDTSTSNIFMVNQAHTSSGSQPLTTNANSAKYDLLIDVASTGVSAAAAATSEQNAANSATAAATSETNAANSATASETSRQASETAQTASETARNAAQTAQAAAEAALDNFDDRFLGAKSSNPSVDNDGNALTDGALYFDTTNNVMKVYDLGNTQWRQIQLSTADQANVNTVASDLSGSNNIGTVAGLNTQISTLAGQSTELTNLNNISAAITGVNNISAAVSAVNSNSSNINAVNSNSSNINTLAGLSGLSTLASNASNINTVATNITGVNSFAARYRVQAGVPSSSNDLGDLVFDTTANKLKVFDGSSYALAGSSVNGTSQRFQFTATAGQTTFTTDDAGTSLTYDVAGGTAFADIYLNGVKLLPADFTASNGTSIVLAQAAAANDVLSVTSFGTFSLANFSASNITSGTIDNDRLPSPTLIVKGDGSSVDGAIQLNCHVNTHGVKIKAPPHSAGQSYTLILPQNTGSNGQVLASNGSSTNQLSWVDAQETKPTVANVSQTIAPATATTINITGTNFVSIPQVDFVNASTGAVTRANTVSFTNATTLSVNVTLASGNYYVRIENPDGNAGRSTNNIITASTAPTFSTNAGSLGTFAGNFSGTIATITGSSDSAVTFSEVGSNLTTANVTLSSAGVLATTDFGGSSTTATQYNFTIRITDAEGQTADRAFSFTSSFGATGGAQFN